MGNTLLDETKKEDPADIFEQWLQQNPDLVNRKVLAHNKLFSSSLFTYCQRSIKLAVYFRRDPNIQLINYLRSFEIIQKLVQYHRCVHILPMRILSLKQFNQKQVRYEQNLIVATRQHLHKTLQERLQSRPPLSEQQKFWFIYQMIFAVYTLHETFNIYHGSIKTSNFLITNYQYLLLTDFASYKPNYILQDTEQGLSEFRLFYQSSVAKCNLPPQKLADRDNLPTNGLNNKLFYFFQQQSSDIHKTSTNNLDATFTTSIPRKVKQNSFGPDIETQIQIQRLKKMDIFSLGLAILQVLNDGQSSMKYQELLKIRKQGLDFQAKIREATQKMQSKHHKNIQHILLSMLQMNPQKRMNITQVQHSFQKCIDLQMFLLFWCCISAFSKSSFTSCDLRIHLLFSIINFIELKVKTGNSQYKFINKQPKCLKGFNSLKIFAEMIEKGLIFAPGVSKLQIFQKLMKHYDKHEEKESSGINNEEVNVHDQDQRRRFFINSHKNSKISLRLSLFAQYKPKQELCPPNLALIENVINIKHIPLKLTEIGLKPSRLQQILRSYKANQGYREDRLRYEPFYKNCEIMIKIIFSCIRSCKYVANKLLGIEMIGMIATDCSDQVLLKLVVPLLMNLTQDNDISVGRQAFLQLLSTFYIFRDPFHNQEDIHYFDVIFEFFISIIKQSKLRQYLFSHFKQVYNICQWLQLHYKCFNKESKNHLNKITQTLKSYYGNYSRQQVKILLNNNIPDHVLPDMFQFYISEINIDRIEGLKLSVLLASNINSLKQMHILEAVDSCIESGLDQYGLGLYYSIQYFKVRKSISSFIIRKISPHVINPNIWIRQQALAFIKMCLDQYPPTKNYFFFRDIFQAPFPLKPQDISFDSLLPTPLKDTDIDIKERKIKFPKLKLTQQLFSDYLKVMKLSKLDRHRQQTEKWNQSKNKAIQGLNFQAYVKKSIEQLYENNLLYYIFNMGSKYINLITDKEKPLQKNYSDLLTTLMKVTKFTNDIGFVEYEKKQLFQSFQGTINSSFEKLIVKKNKNSFEIVEEKIKLAESVILIGQVLNKFQMFKVKPIPKLGNYVRNPVLQQKIHPKGVLISQIFQHSDSVTCLEKVADQFFLSGSNDGTLRIFDSKKIMINITTTSIGCLQIKADNSEQKAKISSIAAFQQTYTAVVGTHRGHIRIIPIQRMPSGNGRQSISTRQDEIIKYNVNGQLQKIITCSNQLKNECFCYITAEGTLGVQDIRVKTQSINVNIGRQRGIPRALCATSRNSILVGTIDGYLINYDIRYNIISSVLQLHNDRQVLPITGIYPSQLQIDQKEQLFSLTYPGKNYQFSSFDLLKNKVQFGPEKQYINMNHDQMLVTPYLKDRTSQEQFKLCRNGLVWRKSYNELSDFNKNFNIYNYLSDPLTRKQSKIRQIWLDNCKNRYNQISSLYNKKNLPFIQYIGTNILTNPNPTKATDKYTSPFILLTEKKQGKEYQNIDRTLIHKPNVSHKIYTFSCEESEEYYTCCKVLPSMIVLGCRNSLVKIYV